MRLGFCVQDYLKQVKISLLSECDILAFVYKHGPNLASTDQIARLIGYESAVVRAALDRLEHEEVIERVGSADGVRLHRLSRSKDAGRQEGLEQLLTLLQSRAGRLLLAKLLRTGRSESETLRTAG
jgi:DNA-binding MarR family transcriptional regulator